MKTKKQFRSPVNLKLLLVLSVFIAVTIDSYACGTKNPGLTQTEFALPQSSLRPPTMAGTDTIWVQVDEMPEFPGGEAALLKYVADNVKYPLTAKTKGTQGKVLLRFCVTSKGSVTACTILKSVSPEIDAEAIRVVNTLPLFEPGKVAGKPVAVWYMLPITFSLK